MLARLVVLLFGVVAASSSTAVSIDALDGFGQPVDWWAILKLPSQVKNAAGKLVPTCDCAAPSCTGDKSRGSGLCYLYADAKHPTFRYFKDLGYDCLGQGGNDPLSQTLKQKAASPYWAYYNDQFYAIAQGESTARQCSGTNAFNAHAKGFLAFDANTGGVALQASIPNYPDPSSDDSGFVPLGCQGEDNVQYAQHLFAMSLPATSMDALGRGLQVARVCSANFYKADAEIMTSASLRAAGVPSSLQSMADALTKPRLPKTPSTTLVLQTKAQMAITSVFKAGVDALPPWALVAQSLDTDVSAATWWDGASGIPTLCAGDVYASASHAFCIGRPLNLTADGTFAFNVENLVAATFPLPQMGQVSWSLLGGVGAGGNHAKWGLSTPRKTGTRSLSVFGDLNMEGFPCSTNCAGSQGGRGGSFHALNVPALHESLASLVSSVCSCEMASNSTGYVQARMCNAGCYKRMGSTFREEELPTLTTSMSYWSKNAALARNHSKNT
ncbi:hypothetical protein SPRG_13129 [Saprolegnia parasitica CBS 223.65]|uniref:Apple domain-containing protein n=1 Tax=Saprolegnia parasitica (strain CBS 223.65) TaxID=695850 RepID=A0A067BTZ7_SAPPC|nr:hypothetical protein SPRG_13129 [Saprolegnia parasitica CBS 223.65]KDO21713.1 hypothetical protein SPRG_13129 [Saprolegnia parasitica CBS 223.65]|eukprot:XP_012207516.1 hypothetical protein SPRG_13129 [Saprolegnia parasitica CBS 223.65]